MSANGRSASSSDQRSDHLAMGGTLIYVLGTTDLSMVKIGQTTQHIARRRRQHEGTGPNRQPFRFAAGVWGSATDEKKIHRYFRRHLVEGEREWFHASEPVLDWVRWLRQQWYVAINEEDADGMQRITSDNWLPESGRESPMTDQLIFDPWDVLTYPSDTGDDYYTDSRIIAAARDVMGGIDLDPASHPAANRIVKANLIHTIATNGLVHPWKGRVWVNPPFHKWDLWTPKIIAEWKSGRVDRMCVLCATRSLTARSVAPMLAASDGLCILDGRVPFWGPLAGSPDDGHAIVYFGSNSSEFAVGFLPLGTCFYTSPNTHTSG